MLPPRGSPARRTLNLTLAALIVVAAFFQVSRLLQPDVLPVDDFVEYWSAARLWIGGGNPYDPQQLKALQDEVRTPDENEPPLLMYNPPYTLPLLWPFAGFSYPIGRLLWLLVQLGILLACVTLVWGMYDGPPGKRWVALMVPLVFVPTYMNLGIGQSSAFFTPRCRRLPMVRATQA